MARRSNYLIWLVVKQLQRVHYLQKSQQSTPENLQKLTHCCNIKKNRTQRPQGSNVALLRLCCNSARRRKFHCDKINSSFMTTWYEQNTCSVKINSWYMWPCEKRSLLCLAKALFLLPRCSVNPLRRKKRRTAWLKIRLSLSDTTAWLKWLSSACRPGEDERPAAQLYS